MALDCPYLAQSFFMLFVCVFEDAFINYLGYKQEGSGG
jgi:hypothetical protein